MPIRIGTAERGGTFHLQGLALKRLLEREPILAPVEIVEMHEASIENARRLEAGDITFGFMAANWVTAAQQGTPPFNAALGVRLTAPMNAGPLFFISLASSPLTRVHDLPGKRIAIGARGSGMAQHAQAILGALGIRAGEFTPVHLDFAAGATALERGDVHAQLQCPIPNRVMTELIARTPLRVLRYGPDEMIKLLAAVPFYRRTLMHKGDLAGLDDDVAQPAVLNLLVTHARVAEATVHCVARAVLAGSAELGRLEPLFGGLSALVESLRKEGLVALGCGEDAVHAGALRAFRES